MTAFPWPALDSARGRALRGRTTRHLLPLGVAGVAAGLAVVAPPSSFETWSALTAVLALSYAAIDAPAAAQAGRAAHQREVLPLLWRTEGVEVRAHLRADPPWVLLARSGLFPKGTGARPGAALVGTVDGTPLEACEVVLTREKIKRKVRKIQVPVCRAGVVVIDLGPGAAYAPAWAVGAWGLTRDPRTGRARRARGPGMPWRSKAWTGVEGEPAWSGEAWSALADLLRNHPRAAVAIPDGRHLIVALDKGDRLFHPVSLWLPVARDARAAQAVAWMRACVRLARALGAGSGASGVGSPSGVPHTAAAGAVEDGGRQSGGRWVATAGNPFLGKAPAIPAPFAVASSDTLSGAPQPGAVARGEASPVLGGPIVARADAGQGKARPQRAEAAGQALWSGLRAFAGHAQKGARDLWARLQDSRAPVSEMDAGQAQALKVRVLGGAAITPQAADVAPRGVEVPVLSVRETSALPGAAPVPLRVGVPSAPVGPAVRAVALPSEGRVRVEPPITAPKNT